MLRHRAYSPGGDLDYDGDLGWVAPSHTFANPVTSHAVMLTTFTPDLYVQYFRDLSNANTWAADN